MIPCFFFAYCKNNSIERKEIGANMLENILNNIKSDVKNISHTSKSNIISELCEKYGSDKGFINTDIDKKPYKWHPHTYATYYHSIFHLSRENIKYVFEFGLGTNNPNLKSNMTEKDEFHAIQEQEGRIGTQ